MPAFDLGLGAPPWIVGHRGAAGEAPENTLDSLLLAIDQGADMVELDLQLTADGELVACHDWTLERMGGVDEVVEQATFEEIGSVEVSGPFRRGSVHRVLATLDEVLTLLPAALPLNLELKRRQADAEAIAEALVTLLEDDRPVLVSSFDWDLLAIVRRRLPEIPLAPLGGRSVDPTALLATADLLAAWSVHCRASVADAPLVAATAEAGRPLLVYTVNEAAEARRLFELGVQGVFSDVPGRLRSALGDAQ